MKAVLNIVAAVLIAAGLVVAVASLLTPGQVILGIDFKLAATLIVGGLILHALASALALLERMSHDLRQLRKAGSEEPPWLRKSAAAMAAAAYAAPLAVDAVAEDGSDEAEDEFGYDTAEGPTAESQAVAYEDEAERESPKAPLPGLEPVEDEESAVESQAELPIDFEPSETVIEDQAEFEREPDPTEATVLGGAEEPSLPEPSEDALQFEVMSEPRPAEVAVEDQAQPASEPELLEDPVADTGEAPSKLKPSEDTFAADFIEPAEPKPVQEQAGEEHAALYVVEERMFRGRQARVLSDGTIEAETAEGWMRFEDFDHLDEYLEAMVELGR